MFHFVEGNRTTKWFSHPKDIGKFSSRCRLLRLHNIIRPSEIHRSTYKIGIVSVNEWVYGRFPKTHFPGKTFPGTALSGNVTPRPLRQTTPSSPLLSVAEPALGRRVVNATRSATTSATSRKTSTTAASVHRGWRCWSTAGHQATKTSAASTATTVLHGRQFRTTTQAVPLLSF